MSTQNTSSSTTQAAKTQLKNTKITRRTLLISAGALGLTGIGTLWWTNTPHYPDEQHQHIADTIKNITDIGDDNNQKHPVKVNITTGLNLPAPDTHQPAPNERTLQTDGITAQKNASTLSAPTVGLNITYTETGLTQTPEYSRPQMILPPSHQAALANFSASLEDPEGPSVIAGHVNYDNNTMAPMSLITLLNVGDPVYASTTHGEITNWHVLNRRSYAYRDLPEDTFGYHGPKLLRLITCGGTDGHGHYTTNIVITCTPA